MAFIHVGALLCTHSCKHVHTCIYKPTPVWVWWYKLSPTTRRQQSYPDQQFKHSSHTCNTCWLADGTDDQGHHLSLSFTYPPFLHFLPSSPFSRQLNSLHKCFAGGTSGCCCQGAFDLISVMHRKNKKNWGKQQQHALGSHGASQWERGAFVPAGQIRCVHPVGARGHTSAPSSGGEDTVWIHKWMIHFLSSRSTFSSPLCCLSAVSLSGLEGAVLKLLGPLDSLPLALDHWLTLVFSLTFLTLSQRADLKNRTLDEMEQDYS